MPMVLNLSPDGLRELRRKLGKTQAEFADMLDVERNTVVRWEMGLHLPVGRRARRLWSMMFAEQRKEDEADAQVNYQ